MCGFFFESCKEVTAHLRASDEDIKVLLNVFTAYKKDVMARLAFPPVDTGKVFLASGLELLQCVNPSSSSSISAWTDFSQHSHEPSL